MRGSRPSAEEERELVVAAERGDRAACRELVASFLPAIAHVARRFDTGGRVQRTELVQEGVAGLLFAARRYDPRLRTPFWGYASFWVRKAMQELVAEVTRPAALSDHAVRALAQIAAARREHLRASGTEPTAAQLSAATGLSRVQVGSLLAVDQAPRSFEEPMGADESTPATFGETIADPAAESDCEQVLDLAPYLCSSSASSRRSGGAWAWWVVRVGCARTPSLISVLVPGFRSGDMMVDGVFRDAVRPLCL